MTNEYDGGRSPFVGAGVPASRQVNWYETFDFVQRYAADHGVQIDHHLIAGSPRWCGMTDDDARKLLSLLLGGVRDALRNDTHQAEMAESSREIARTVDCAAIASRVRGGRGAAYIPRRKETA